MNGSVAELIAEPTRCFVYGLSTASSEVIVFDTAAKDELTRISLSTNATDMDLSSNGQWLVVAHDALHQVSVIDTQRLCLTRQSRARAATTLPTLPSNEGTAVAPRPH